jgi:hypothetical protein
MNATYVYALQQETDRENLDRLEELLREQQAIGGEVFRVPLGRINQLQEHLEKLNKKAAKLGTAPITLRDTGERDETIERIHGRKRKVEWAYVVVSGKTPVLNGWVFMATVEHGENGNVIHTLPEYARPTGMKVADFTSFRQTGKICEHCNKYRNRKDTYLVQNFDTNKVKQVGSTCLADFTGINNPQAHAKWFESLYEWQSFMRGGYEGVVYADPQYDLWSFLALANVVVRKHGYKSVKKAQEEGGTPTAHIARSEYLWQEGQRGLDHSYDPTDEDEAMATKVIEWVRTVLTPKAQGDYEQNLATIFASSTLTSRQMGIAASAIMVYNRETQPKPQKAAQVEYADEWLGTVGQKDFFRAECMYVGQWFQSDYSDFMKRKVQFKNITGHKLVWYTTSQTEFEVGKTYEFNAKITGHKQDKFGKYTSVGGARKVVEARPALAV